MPGFKLSTLLQSSRGQSDCGVQKYLTEGVEMFEVIGFKNINTYGDYELGSFDLANSDRCIIICSK